jgi:hypothetical protein
LRLNRSVRAAPKLDAWAFSIASNRRKEPIVTDHKADVKNPHDAPAQPKAGAEKKPMSEQATHQGGGDVNKDHKPHGAGPIPKGRS